MGEHIAGGVEYLGRGSLAPVGGGGYEADRSLQITFFSFRSSLDVPP